MWFPEVNGNLDICKGLANWAYGYKIWNIYIIDVMNRHLDKNSASVQQTLAVISVPCVPIIFLITHPQLQLKTMML